MLTTKITYALADWIREWRKCRKENPSLDDCIKFTEWKIENYELTDGDRIIIDSIYSKKLKKVENFINLIFHINFSPSKSIHFQ